MRGIWCLLYVLSATLSTTNSNICFVLYERVVYGFLFIVLPHIN